MKYVGIYDLRPIDGRKSFYGKAQIIRTNGCVYLRSYSTIVCGMNDFDKFEKLWHGYSATTLRHINAFRAMYGLSTLSKAEWLSL